MRIQSSVLPTYQALPRFSGKGHVLLTALLLGLPLSGAVGADTVNIGNKTADSPQAVAQDGPPRPPRDVPPAPPPPPPKPPRDVPPRPPLPPSSIPPKPKDIIASGKLLWVPASPDIENAKPFWALKITESGRQALYQLVGLQNQDDLNKRLTEWGEGVIIRVTGLVYAADDKHIFPRLIVKDISKLHNAAKTIKGHLKEIQWHPEIDEKIWVFKEEGTQKVYRLRKRTPTENDALDKELKALGENVLIRVEGREVDKNTKTPTPWTVFHVEKIEKAN